MQPVISASELKELLKSREIVMIDARSGSDTGARYQAGHLPGALPVDLEKELSERKADAADGGRHPLPSPQAFASLLGQLGIQPSSYVVVYDDKAGANAAARFWWMLKATGHKTVQVLDGGMKAAIAEGIDLVPGAEKAVSLAAYPFNKWQMPIADINAVAAVQPGQLVIDVRESYRYKGESEPIDLVAGHIPGAVNIPYTGNLDNEGHFLPADELAKKYKAAIGDKDPAKLIVHCGSGVTACHTLLALEQAGIKGANLYVGSWSEWSRNGQPIATGD